MMNTAPTIMNSQFPRSNPSILPGTMRSKPIASVMKNERKLNMFFGDCMNVTKA